MTLSIECCFAECHHTVLCCVLRLHKCHADMLNIVMLGVIVPTIYIALRVP
jgi:hypothetical protein